MFKWEQNKNWKRRFQFDILLTKIWKENQNLKEDEKQHLENKKYIYIYIHVIGGQDKWADREEEFGLSRI